MIIHPNAVHMGEYLFVTNALSEAKAYVLDDTNHVFEILPDCNLQEVGFLRGLKKIQRYCELPVFHPKGAFTAYITETGMAVSDLQGNRIWQMETPVAGLLFSQDGDELWLVERLGAERIRVSLIDAGSGMENAVMEMEDPIYDSSIRLKNMPQGGSVLLELAAGQDGVAVFLLTDDGSLGGPIYVKELFPNSSNLIPAFNPDCTRLLTLENDESLYYSYTWPELEMVARQGDYTDAERNDDNDRLCHGYEMLYLKNGLAVTQSGDYRFYLFDPIKMERIDELVIAGFEPLPVNEVFPRLKEDAAPYSIVTVFERHGGFLAAATGKSAKQQALMIFREEDFLKQLGTNGGDGPFVTR